MNFKTQPQRLLLPFLKSKNWNAFFIGSILLLWGAAKLPWEIYLQKQRHILKLQETTFHHDLSKKLSQNMIIGLLGGFRGIIADFVWLRVTDRFQERDWLGLQRNIDLATTLQPHFIPFWDLGGWHLAWNASVDAKRNRSETSTLWQRLKAERFWIQKGEDCLQHGIISNPDTYRLYFTLGLLQQQKKQNYLAAASYYLMASEKKDAPLYLERFPAYMYEKANRPEKAYAHWKKLYQKNKKLPFHPEFAQKKTEEELKKWEEKLQIPTGKRIFPK